MAPMTAPAPVKRASAVRALKAYILDHGLVPGDPLPSESRLQEELALSRTSLREAVRELQTCGIVDVRHGDGMCVGSLRLDALRDALVFHATVGPHQQQRLRQLVEVREALELGLITSLALARLSPDSERLAELLRQMDRESEEGSISVETDRAFHRALYDPLDNPVATQLLEVLWDATGTLVPPLLGRAEAMATADRHHSLLLALRAGDPRGARVAMQNHFVNLRRRLGMGEATEGA